MTTHDDRYRAHVCRRLAEDIEREPMESSGDHLTDVFVEALRRLAVSSLRNRALDLEAGKAAA